MLSIIAPPWLASRPELAREALGEAYPVLLFLAAMVRPAAVIRRRRAFSRVE
jgi:hypothetical protein